MKRIFFMVAIMASLGSCSDSGTKNGASKDTITPQNSTAPTPTNPGGLQPNGGNGTSNSDSGANRMNHDSSR